MNKEEEEQTNNKQTITNTQPYPIKLLSPKAGALSVTLAKALTTCFSTRANPY